MATAAALPHGSRTKELLITNVTLLSLATIVIGLRFYTRTRISHYIGSDDWWILAALLVGVIQVGLWTAYDNAGNARHVWDVPYRTLGHYFGLLWVIQMTYTIGCACIKISILSLYLRLFPSPKFRILVRASMVFIIAMSTGCLLANMFQCLPVQSNWETALWHTRKCVARDDIQLAAAALGFATDIAILVMPLKYLIALPVATRYKIQVVVLMSLGALTCIASIVRFRYIFVVESSKDPTWDGFWLSFWTALEYHLGLITSSVPAIKPLWVKYVGSRFSSLRGNHSSADSEESKPTEISMPYIP